MNLRGILLLMLLVAAVLAAGLPQPFDLAWQDRQSRWLAQHWPRPTPNDIVVIGIDEASLDSFGVPVATLHRQLGTLLQTMAVARPRAVAFDVVLPERSFDRIQPGLDAALARGILVAKASRVPIVFGMAATDDGGLRPVHPLFTSLLGPQGLASIFVTRDADGTVRRFDERLGADGQIITTLPGQLARRIGVTIGYGQVPMFWDRHFDYIPLATVLNWQATHNVAMLHARFANKVVFVGSMLPYEDMHRVAVTQAIGDSADTTHGVFILALQLRALMSDTLIHELPRWLVLLLALLMVQSWWLIPGRWSVIGVLVLTGGLNAGAVLALRQGWALPMASLSGSLILGLASRSTLAAWLAAKERRRLRSVFGGFVSPGVLKEILAGRLTPNLAGEKHEVCVLFSDVRDFTTMSEHLSPEQVMDLLNRYFERMAATVHRHGGTLDKFIGDGLMAFFGAPQQLDNPCAEAFQAACEMLVELDAFNAEQRELGGPCIEIGIGLHFGPASIGYIGATNRHEYSAIGDTVNSASRLESATKGSGYPIIVSRTVWERLMQPDELVNLGERPLKGRAPMEVFGWRPQGESA
jgi:class 3 adenylate cyclase/CHASE2 domain-containing sensor protein